MDDKTSIVIAYRKVHKQGRIKNAMFQRSIPKKYRWDRWNYDRWRSYRTGPRVIVSSFKTNFKSPRCAETILTVRCKMSQFLTLVLFYLNWNVEFLFSNSFSWSWKLSFNFQTRYQGSELSLKIWEQSGYMVSIIQACEKFAESILSACSIWRITRLIIFAQQLNIMFWNSQNYFRAIVSRLETNFKSQRWAETIFALKIKISQFLTNVSFYLNWIFYFLI